MTLIREDDGIVDRIYGSLFDPSELESALNDIRRQLHAPGILIVDMRYGIPGHNAIIAGEFNLELVRLCESEYPDNIMGELLSRLNDRQWINTADHISLSDLQRTPFYNDILRPQQFDHSIGGILSRSSSRLVTVGVGRGLKRGRFENDELAKVGVYLPHLQRVTKLRTRTPQWDVSASQNFSVLDELHLGVVVLDAGGRVLFTNRACNDIAARHGIPKMSRDGIAAAVPAESARLRQLIAALLRNEHHPGVALKTAAGASLVVVGAPVRGTMVERFHDEGIRSPHAMLFISDLSRTQMDGSSIVSDVFGLTPAETRLLRILSEGAGLREAARTLGIAETTAKTHLARIFHKTGTARQTELISLIARFPRVRLD